VATKIANLTGPQGPQGPPGGSGIQGYWQLAATGSVPGGAQMSTSHADLADSTWLRFTDIDKMNVDFHAVLMAQVSGNTILLQEKMDSANWAVVEVTGASTDAGSYVEVPMRWMRGAGSTSSALWQEVTALFTLGTSTAGVLPPGGTTSQVLAKKTATDYDTQWTTLTKASVGLGNVDNTADVDKPISTPTKNYINSRGLNLITNGSGLLNNNYNFPGWNFITNDRPVGAQGAFQTKTPAPGSGSNEEFIAINPALAYDMSFAYRQAAGDGTRRFYSMVVPYDVDKLQIQPYHYMEQANTRTTLAADLKPGDTTVQLTSAANWNNAAGASDHLRKIIFWDYVDGTGYKWPPGTYSRHYTPGDTWADGAIVGNVITLRVPWATALVPAGTVVGNGSSGGSYMYGANNVLAPSTWTNYGPYRYSGVHTNLTLAATTSFPTATSYVKVGFLQNYPSGATDPTAVALFSNVMLLLVGSGEQWLSGVGLPAASLGMMGDWYINESTGDVYEKTSSSTWTWRLKLSGPQGAAGTPGSKWWTAATTPASGTGVVGDFFLNTANGDIYEKTGTTTWTNRGNIKGPKGDTGAAGAAGADGAQGPKGDTGAQGVPGPDGAQGTQGPQGVPGPQGDPGPTGPEGPQGSEGEQGTSVTLVGSVPTTGDLPTNLGPDDAGTGYIVEGDGNLWVWDGTQWVDVGQIVGPQGPQGVQGVPGDPGPKGDQGIQGIQGTQGIQGVPGTAGTPGLSSNCWRMDWSTSTTQPSGSMPVGTVRVDVLGPGITKIWASSTSRDALTTNLLANVKAGDVISFTLESNPTAQLVNFYATGVPTLSGNWFTIPVSIVGGTWDAAVDGSDMMLCTSMVGPAGAGIPEVWVGPDAPTPRNNYLIWIDNNALAVNPFVDGPGSLLHGFWAEDPNWTDRPVDGAKVSSWRNQGGGAAVQATSVNQPTFVSSVAALGGRAGVQFGTGFGLVQDVTDKTVPYWVVGIVRLDSASTPSRAWMGMGVANGGMGLRSTTNNWFASAGTVLDANQGPDTLPHLIVGQLNTAGQIAMDGQIKNSGTTGTTSLTYLSIGCDNAAGVRGSLIWPGSIHFLAVYSVDPRTDVRWGAITALAQACGVVIP
jgi:Collagen triple helix repeat (20 copies)